MAVGKRKRSGRQSTMWIATNDLPTTVAHPFYERLNQILDKAGFDAHVDGLCARFYAETIGRPGLAPAYYFRLLLTCYFERLDSERAIARTGLPITIGPIRSRRIPRSPRRKMDARTWSPRRSRRSIWRRGQW